MRHKVEPQVKTELYVRYLKYWVEQIKDQELQVEVVRVLSAAPDYFWTKGYYHTEAPADEKNVNGVLRRVVKNCYYAKSLAEAWNLGEHLDIVLAAALLHDCVKFGLEEVPVERKFHGPFTADWIESGLGGHAVLSSGMVDTLEVIRKHDGIAWTNGNEPKMSPLKNFSPYDWLALTVCSADMVASRTVTVFSW